MKTIIELEDNGQDFLFMITDEDGIVLETQPFQTSVWKGAVIPINDKEMMKVGNPLPIHHPPNINFGFLKHNILKVSTK